MLNAKEAVVTIPVKDTNAARSFYEQTLGLQPAEDAEGNLSFKSGAGNILVYESQYAGTNQATAVTWIVGKDLDSIVGDLRGKGVQFEHYPDMPETKIEGDIHVSGKLRVAWFKDPDGNIHALVNG